MTAIDRDHVAKLFAAGEAAATTTERGRVLEDLIAYLFELIPGITVTARNEMNAFEAEEIDVAFWNEEDPDGLRNFECVLLVECKNRATAATYQDVAVFYDKMQSRGRKLGIFVAAAGITGKPVGTTAAHSILARALSHGHEIIVITRSEIEQLCEASELVRLLKKKRAQLIVSGTLAPRSDRFPV